MELRPGYKKTEIGVIPEDWDVRKIRQICKLINGRGFKPHEWEIRGFPIIRIQNLNGSEDFNYFNGTFNEKILVESGQLLFAWSGSRGTSFGPHLWRGQTAVLNYHTWKVNVSEQEVDPDYFYYALRHLTEFIEENAHGASALVHTQKWEMEGFNVAIPQRTSEQEDIAEALSDVDSSITALSQLIAKKRDLRLGAMQCLLTGQTRLPGFGSTARARKSSDVGDIPDDWDAVQLGLVGEILIGLTYSPSDVAASGTLVLRSSNIQNDALSFIDNVYVDAAIPERLFVRSGDVLICVRNGSRALIGKTALLDERTAGMTFGAFMAILRSDIGELVSYLFQTGIMKRQIDEHLGATINQITNKSLKSFKIPLSRDPEERKEIARTLQDMDAEIAALETRIEKARTLKQAMMQALLTGRVRLPVRRDVAPQTKEAAHA